MSIFFLIDRETSHDAQCSKARALTKVVDLILEIESFQQIFVILKGLLNSDRIKQHMITIGIYQLLSIIEM